MEKEIEKYINSVVKYEPDKERLRMYIKQFGVNPLMGEITYNNNYNKREKKYTKGTIIVSFEIYLARAWETNQFLGIEIKEHYKDEELVSIEAIGKRRIGTQGEYGVAMMTFNAFLSEYRPKQEFLSEYSPWVKMPNVMLRKCAIANVVRQLFADILRLPYIQEELESGTFQTKETETTEKEMEPKTINWEKRIEQVDVLYNTLLDGELLSEEQNGWVDRFYNKIGNGESGADLVTKLNAIKDFCKQKLSDNE